MEIKRNSIFNLWDTNGRRKDVINALEIYLRILKEEKENFPDEIWSSYPESTSQFRFYERAISESPEIFKRHDGYDRFMERIAGKREAFIRKSRLGEVTEMDFDDDMQKWLDESIEQRARHYTSNLVKIFLLDCLYNVLPSAQ